MALHEERGGLPKKYLKKWFYSLNLSSGQTNYFLCAKQTSMQRAVK